MKSDLESMQTVETDVGNANDYHIAPEEDIRIKQNPEEIHSVASLEIEEPKTTLIERVKHLYEKESLLIEVGIAVLIAYIYPPLGAIYVAPEITAHWVAVIIIFFASGLALDIKDLSRSIFNNVKFNIVVSCYNFFLISFVVDYVANYFLRNELVNEDLMKGMIICSCLPMPTNMLLVIVMSSGGDEATALVLATAMNLLGVFLSPLLILFYLGEKSDFDFISAYKSLGFRVLLPVFVGCLMRHNIDGVIEYCEDNVTKFGMIRQRCLVWIVFATFSHTFNNEFEASTSQFLTMAAAQIVMFLAAQIIAWFLMFILFNGDPKLRVTGLFACSMKTAALGIPLITAIYTDHPRLGIYTMPLLVWYPTQLILGTLISSKLNRFVGYKLSKQNSNACFLDCGEIPMCNQSFGD